VINFITKLTNARLETLGYKTFYGRNL
jgi:hypothetical protein